MSNSEQDHQQQVQASNDENQLVGLAQQTKQCTSKIKTKKNKVFKPYHQWSVKNKNRSTNYNNNNFYQRLPLSYQMQPFGSSFTNSSNWQGKKSTRLVIVF